MTREVFDVRSLPTAASDLMFTSASDARMPTMGATIDRHHRDVVYSRLFI